MNIAALQFFFWGAHAARVLSRAASRDRVLFGGGGFRRAAGINTRAACAPQTRISRAPHFIKEQQAIDAAIGAFAFAFFERAGADKGEGPMLELELVVFGELASTTEIGRLPFLFELDLFAEGIAQAPLDQIDSQIGDIDPGPFSTKLLRRVSGMCRITQNGSSTTSPRLLLALMMRSRRATGFCVG